MLVTNAAPKIEMFFERLKVWKTLMVQCARPT